MTVAGGIDREADGPSPDITVRATSSDGSFADKTFAIAINDIDEFDVSTPIDTNGATNVVDENAANGTSVGVTAFAADDDATNNTVTYELIDDAGGRFAIDPTTGEVTVAGGIDREADGPSLNITVRAASTDGSFADKTFAVAINDVDESPSGVDGNNEAPVNTIPASIAARTITDKAIAGLALSDADADAGVLTTALHVDNGILKAASAGGAAVAGSGTDTLTLTGTLAQINTTLSALNNVIYHSDAGFLGTDTLTMTTTDNGNTGLGGPLTDTNSMALLVRPNVATNDFNADGTSDILWRHDSGAVASWELDHEQIGYHYFGLVENVYHVAAIGDFDGNGTADILWRHDLGHAYSWNINGGTQTGYHYFGPQNPANVVEGTGDFNGDGKTDILWRNADTHVVSWQLNAGEFNDTDLNGDEIAGTQQFGPVSQDWKFVGSGDVNGDGTTDIFWRHTSGQLVSWEIDNGAIIGYNNYGHVDNDYQVAGTGDFNGDGKSGDILWRHFNGQVAAWELEGGQQIGYLDFGHVSNDYQIEETGDYNGDGNSDVLWRHVSGQVVTWELDGGNIVHYHDLGHVDTIWQIQKDPPF